MPCYHPLLAIPIGINLETGKPKYRICKYNEDVKAHEGSCLDADPISYPGVPGDLAPVVIPCGRCLGCRLDYSRQWANRCLLELGYHKSSWFVTLTYDDGHVPITYHPDPKTGEAIPGLSLRYEDFQLFMKRLRKNSGQKIRFYMAAEYGSTTYRPHYHVILYGLELDDLEVYERTALGHTLYTSKFLQDCWSVRECKEGEEVPTLTPIGKVVVGSVTWESCAYVARYVTKKLMGPDAYFYDCHNLERPRTCMSRKPGIGRQYYDDHPDLFDYEFINISTEKGGKKFYPPKYFERLLEVDNPELFAERKKKKKELAEEAQKAKLAQTDLSYLEMLAVQEREKEKSVKLLRRDEV